MATELEIKLTLSEQAQAQAADWLLAQPEAARGGRKTLLNRYYDTVDAALNQAKAALRVRQAGNRFIQTLKTQGEYVGGAHRRQEWEWPLPSEDLDLTLLAQTPLSDQLDLQRLHLAFETNFNRQVIMLEAAGSVIEVAVDSGNIVGGDQSRPLHEVEFELKSGQPESLMTWARALADEVPVFLNLVSKAEQGYYLAGLYRSEAEAAESFLTVTQWLRQLSRSWLTGSALNIPESSLALVQKKAAACDLLDIWAQVQREIGNGCTAQELIQRVPRLGVLQLALAAD